MPSKDTDNKKFIDSVDGDGKKIKIAVLRPSPKNHREARKIYNRAFRDALESGALLRQKLGDYMREQGLWNEEKEKMFDKLMTRINNKQKNLSKGGIKLSEAKELALSIKEDRLDFQDLIAERSALDSNTAEGQSDNVQFNYLVAACVVDAKTGDQIFVDEDGQVSVDAYEKRSGEEFASEAAGKLAELVYGLDEEYEQNLPENEFLKKFSFVDKELRLINKDGHLVDNEGRLVNEEGRFIDKDGKYVNIIGESIDEEGDLLSSSTSPFLDEEGNPIEDEKNAKKTLKTKKDQEVSVST